MSKDFLDRVKENQVAKAAAGPLPLITVSVSLMADNTVQIRRPEGDAPAHLAGVVDLLATGIKIVAHKIAQGEPSRIVTVPPGTKVQ